MVVVMEGVMRGVRWVFRGKCGGGSGKGRKGWLWVVAVPPSIGFGA